MVTTSQLLASDLSKSLGPLRRQQNVAGQAVSNRFRQRGIYTPLDLGEQTLNQPDEPGALEAFVSSARTWASWLGVEYVE